MRSELEFLLEDKAAESGLKLEEYEAFLKRTLYSEALLRKASMVLEVGRLVEEAFEREEGEHPIRSTPMQHGSGTGFTVDEFKTYLHIHSIKLGEQKGGLNALVKELQSQSKKDILVYAHALGEKSMEEMKAFWEQFGFKSSAPFGGMVYTPGEKQPEQPEQTSSREPASADKEVAPKSDEKNPDSSASSISRAHFYAQMIKWALDGERDRDDNEYEHKLSTEKAVELIKYAIDSDVSLGFTGFGMINVQRLKLTKDKLSKMSDEDLYELATSLDVVSENPGSISSAYNLFRTIVPDESAVREIGEHLLRRLESIAEDSTAIGKRLPHELDAILNEASRYLPGDKCDELYEACKKLKLPRNMFEMFSPDYDEALKEFLHTWRIAGNTNAHKRAYAVLARTGVNAGVKNFFMGDGDLTKSQKVTSKNLENTLRKLYEETQEYYRKKKGKKYNTPVKVTRGIGFLPEVDKEYAPSPVESWTLQPSTAYTFAAMMLDTKGGGRTASAAVLHGEIQWKDVLFTWESLGDRWDESLVKGKKEICVFGGSYTDNIGVEEIPFYREGWKWVRSSKKENRPIAGALSLQKEPAPEEPTDSQDTSTPEQASRQKEPEVSQEKPSEPEEKSVDGPPKEVPKHLKYLQKHEETGLTSKDPGGIIGSKIVWIWNAKYGLLQKFSGDSLGLHESKSELTGVTSQPFKKVTQDFIQKFAGMSDEEKEKAFTDYPGKERTSADLKVHPHSLVLGHS